jgi:hypothetical protein
MFETKTSYYRIFVYRNYNNIDVRGMSEKYTVVTQITIHVV